jgi:hypothetical protein
VEKLKSLCLQYATSVQILIPSTSMQLERDTRSATTARIKKSQPKEQQLKLALENTTISDSIMYVISDYFHIYNTMGDCIINFYCNLGWLIEQSAN